MNIKTVLMKKMFSILLLAISLSVGAQTGAYNEQAEAYIARYKGWAIEEQQRTGVPAAITLAQGIHETQAGTSELATEANNHFGIKCKKTWTGETFAHTDDAPDECFRKYAKAYDSYKDHSDYLKQSPRYMHCFEQEVTDYAGWARELKAAGYATNPKYAQKLVRIIEDFHLQDYTYAAMKAPQPQGEGLAKVTEEVNIVPREEARRIEATVVKEEKPVAIEREEKTVAVKEEKAEIIPVERAIPEDENYTEPTPVYDRATMRNNLKGFYARKGDVLLEAAIKYNMRYARLLELNDLPDAPLEADMFIYTEKKRALGIRSKHTVKEGETILLVAQSEGIQARQIRLLNGFTADEEPAVGAVLNLQSEALGKPKTAGRKTIAYVYHQPTEVTREEATVATGRQPAKGKIEMETDVVMPVKNSAPVTAIKDEPATPAPTPAVKEEAMPVTKAQAEPKRTPTAPQHQKTYTIADELAVGEEAPKYSPRYRSGDAANPAAQTTQSAQPAAEEPQDDFSRLKARMDKAVYAPKPEPKPRQEPVNIKATLVAPTTAPVAPATSSTPLYHIVKPGETAFGIAKENSVTMKQLREWNNLNFETLKTGQKLRVR